MRGQAHTLEAFAAAALLVTSLFFAMQITAVTPLSASTSSQGIENQQRTDAEDALQIADREDELGPTLLHWDDETGAFHGLDPGEQYAPGELDTPLGERLAADLATVDRLARTGSAVELERELPAAVVGATYRIGIDGERLVLRSERADGSVTVSFVAERDVEIAGGDSLGGGPVVIAFEDETIEVRDG